MFPRLDRSFRSVSAASLLIAAAGSAPLFAQCDVYRPGIPDFDQRRNTAVGIPGLPNNGSMHCVPTSAADAVAFAANHGAPQLMFNNFYDWDSPATYNVATDLIDDLGTLMGTDEGGTNSSGYVNGMTAFINARAPGQFIAGSVGFANGNSVSPEDVHDIIASGGFALIIRGTYGPEEGNPNILHRIGGHILLARNVYDACSNSPNIGMRDPNSSDDRFVNSPWGVYREDLHEETSTYRLANGTTQQRTYWEWSNDYGQNHKVFDGIMTFTPTFALTGAIIEGEEAGIHVVRPLNLTGGPRPTHSQIVRLPEGSGPISSLEILPNLTGAVVFSRSHAGGGGGGQGKCHFMDLSFSTSVVREGPEFATPIVDSCTSRDGVIYAAESGHVHMLVAMADGSVRFLNSGIDVGPILACAFNDADDDLVLITGAAGSPGGHVKVFDGYRGGIAVLDAPLPTMVQLAGDVGLVVDPHNNNTLLVCSEGIPVIYRLALTPSGTVQFIESIPLPAGSEPRNPQVRGDGAILFTSDGQVTELRRNANGGFLAVPGFFAGYEFGANFSLATGRDGVSRVVQTDGDQTNIDDERLPSPRDCGADFNDDGTVNSQDLFDYLRAFFELSPRADVNDDGLVNSQDFFDFLAIFFTGCR